MSLRTNGDFPFRLGRKLALLSMAIGLAMASALGAFATWLDYRAEMARNGEQLAEITRASLPALQGALWLGDAELVGNYLDGLMQFRDMAQVELHWADNFKPPLFRGIAPPAHVATIVRTIPINRAFRGRDTRLGTLTLTFSLERVQGELRDSFWRVLLTQILQMSALAALILLAFQRLGGRRLQQMCDDTIRYRGGETAARMSPAHRPTAHAWDELDQLAVEFNSLLDSQERFMDDLRTANTSLNQEVVERQRAELALRQARDAAETANRAKSTFLANMSHELRTPLNAILGFSSMMRRNPQLSESQAESLDIINRSGGHLLALINDVLEMAKIEAGRVKLEIAPFDLDGMVRDVADMMRLRAEEKGLQLLFDQSSEFPRHIRGDEARLRQILVNLLGNAVKFTTQGGVTIRLGVKRNDRQHLLMEIEDTGPGISAEDQQRIFQPFVQLVEGAEQKGTGLGLTITRQFVELMGGSIAIESTLGKGSLFRVELPVELVGAADIPAAMREDALEVVDLAPGQPTFRILIAEDQPENQMLLTRLMTGIGLETRVAENGKQCVQLFQDWRPDLIWMDRRMPVMDGVAATRRIRLLPGGEAVKIVAVTASAFKEQQQEMRAAGMDDFVSKPYRFGEIYDCLARQLEIKYIYRADATEAQVAPVALTPAMMAGLPATLRQELRVALGRLDSEQISALIEQVAAIDAQLASALSQLADGFDYAAILRILDETET